MARDEAQVLLPELKHHQHYRTPKQRTLAALFVLKATFAFVLSCAAIAYQLYLIHRLHSLAPRPDKYRPGLPILPFPAEGGGEDALRCHFTSNASSNGQSGRKGLARLEPPDGHFYWGFDLQWDRDLPASLVKRTELKPAIFNTFININATYFPRDEIHWMAQQVGAFDAILQITLIPVHQPVERIPDTQLYAFAQTMRHVNSFYGVPVLLRWMHEMNGNWAPEYGQRPLQFKQAFMTLSAYIRHETNMTAMMWAPNTGAGYPYTGTHTPPRSDPNFALLDTNGNGRLDAGDDPYSPYWPGEEFVDWVGLSVYNSHVDAATKQTAVPPVGLMMESVEPFYSRYSLLYGKPFGLGETGSAFLRNTEASRMARGREYVVEQQGGGAVAHELAMKRAWWQAILANYGPARTAGHYTLWKSAVWFEEIKEELHYWDSSMRVMKDYRITYSPEMVKAFQTDLALADGKKGDKEGGILWSDRLFYSCNGQVHMSPA